MTEEEEDKKKFLKKLREKTGAGIMDCMRALTEAKGDFDKALKVLEKRGHEIAAKKADRQAKEGLVVSYIHPPGKIGVLVELNCETDFVARCDDFKNLARDIAMQIAAANPSYLSREDVPADEIKDQKDGPLENFYQQRCLLEQPFIKDESRTVRDCLTQVIAKVGENIVIRRFARYQLGN